LDPSGEWTILLVVSSVCFLSFLIERALRTFSWARLDTMVEGHARRQRLEEALDSLPAMTGLCVTVGTLAAAGVAVSLVMMFVARVMGKAADGQRILLPYAGLVPAVGIAGLVLVVLVWILPGLIARRHAERIVIAAAPSLAKGIGLFQRLGRGHAEQSEAAPAAEANGGFSPVSAADDREAEEEAREIYLTALRFRNVPVSEIMTPRTDMVSVEDDATLEAVRQMALKCGFSRIPVFHENRDNIVGVLYAKDLLAHAANGKWEQTPLTDILRNPYFVPETKPVGELLNEFQARKVHIGIVLDEYGGTAGVVTIEDIIEEIVGEIEDEHGVKTAEGGPMRLLDPRTAEADGRVPVDELNEVLNLDLPEDEDFETVGGLISFTLGRIPESGEEFVRGNVRFHVLDADHRRVKRVRVQLLSAEPDD